jgi:bifunctional non-homologous end joining protein LigD
MSSPHLAFSGSAAGDGEALLAQACRNGLEGLIAKRADGRYESARSRAWLKLKCTQRQEFVVGAYTDPAGSRTGFGALLLGVHDPDGSLRYVGKVGTGFDNERLDTLAKTLKRLERKTPPFANPPRGAEARAAHWLEPKLVAEVSFSQWTDEGLLRQAVFQGLRDDKKASDITIEQAVAVAPAGKPKAVGSLFAGIRITHPDRVIYPDVGVTKAELAAYYDAAAAQILPHLEARPLSLVRCPEGAAKQCFFQKHALNGVVGVDTIDIRESDGVEPYMIVNSAQALISLVQMGTIELHTWGASAPQIERPDRMIFDLDPDEGLDWSLVIDAARLVKTVLDELGLKSFLKTTGGKGLHIVVPLASRHDWEAVKGFSGAVAEHIAGVVPERFTANMSKARRKGRIFIDFHRNDRGATAIAAWSARARSMATISVPIAWDELDVKLTSSHFNVRNVGARLAQKQDPWAGYWTLRQNLTADMRRALARAARR